MRIGFVRRARAVSRLRLASRFAFSLGVALVLFHLAPAHAAPSPAPIAALAVCWGGEQPVFACGIKGSTKSVALCLSGDHLVYRFGSPAKIELTYPADGIPATAAFQRTEAVQSRDDQFMRTDGPTEQQQLSFHRGQTVYLLTQIEDQRPGREQHSAQLSVDQGKKHFATLTCEDDFFSHWSLLDGRLFDAVSASVAAPSSSSTSSPGSIAGSPASSAAAPIVCDEGKTPLSGYPKKVTAAFRKLLEETDGFYRFAVDQFGAAQSCSVAADFVAGIDESTDIDASSFMGTMRFNFAGAVLVYSNPGALDATLVAPAGFPDEAKAKALVEKEAGFSFKKATKRSEDEASAAQRFHDLWDPAWDKPPFANDATAALKTTVLQDPNTDEGEQTMSAALTYRGKKLVAIRTHE